MKEREKEYYIKRTIRDAILIKRAYLRKNLPKQPKCLIGKNILITNEERSYEDIKEDETYLNMMKSGDETVELVFNKWLPLLTPFEQAVVILRCIPGTYWELVIQQLVDNNYCLRRYSSRQLRRIFDNSIKKIAENYE